MISNYKFADFINFLKDSENSSILNHEKIITSINLSTIITSLEFINQFRYPIDIRLSLYLIIFLSKAFDLETITLFRHIIAIHVLKNDEFLKSHDSKNSINEIILDTNKEEIPELVLNIIPLIFGVSLTIFNSKDMEISKFNPSSTTFFNLINININSPINTISLLQNDTHFDIIYSNNEILETLMIKENLFAFAKYRITKVLRKYTELKINEKIKDENIEDTVKEKNIHEFHENLNQNVPKEETVGNGSNSPDNNVNIESSGEKTLEIVKLPENSNIDKIEKLVLNEIEPKPLN